LPTGVLGAKIVVKKVVLQPAGGEAEIVA